MTPFNPKKKKKFYKTNENNKKQQNCCFLFVINKIKIYLLANDYLTFSSFTFPLLTA